LANVQLDGGKRVISTSTVNACLALRKLKVRLRMATGVSLGMNGDTVSVWAIAFKGKTIADQTVSMGKNARNILMVIEAKV